MTASRICLTPVVTDPRKAVMALKWTVREMERRYQMMSKLGVRSIEGYNARIVEAREKGETLVRKVQTGFDPDSGQPIIEEQPFDLAELPLIVVIVDEMADLMLVAGKDIEASVQRLAQMARAAGIHIIMATQRPSVDVITGTIKANFPTRISFQVTSKIDSRTILGEGGAEQLLGRGDMLYMAGGGRVTRVHGPFVSDEEVERVVSALKARAEPDYVEEITEDASEGGGEFSGFDDDGGTGDQLYDQAVALVTRERKASTSFVQRHLQIGYNRAARIIEKMETEGVVGAANHVGKREVLARGGGGGGGGVPPLGGGGGGGGGGGPRGGGVGGGWGGGAIDANARRGMAGTRADRRAIERLVAVNRVISPARRAARKTTPATLASALRHWYAWSLARRPPHNRARALCNKRETGETSDELVLAILLRGDGFGSVAHRPSSCDCRAAGAAHRAGFGRAAANRRVPPGHSHDDREVPPGGRQRRRRHRQCLGGAARQDALPVRSAQRAVDARRCLLHLFVGSGTQEHEQGRPPLDAGLVLATRSDQLYRRCGGYAFRA